MVEVGGFVETSADHAQRTGHRRFTVPVLWRRLPVGEQQWTGHTPDMVVDFEASPPLLGPTGMVADCQDCRESVICSPRAGDGTCFYRALS